MLASRRRRRRIAWAAAAAVVIGGLAPAILVNRDSDDDGIADCREREGLRAEDGDETWRSDPIKRDTDGDGVADGEEVLRHQPRRNVADLAGLLWSCSSQTWIALSDPASTDSDADGLVDAVELSESSSAFVADADDDGLDDSDERQWGADPTDQDTDGDKIVDGEDVDDGLSPVRFDKPLDRSATARELGEGFFFGERKVIDTVPQFLGFIGRTVGVSAFEVARSTGVSTPAAVAKVVRVSRQFVTFVRRSPTAAVTLARTVAAWSRVPASVRVGLLSQAQPKGVAALRKAKLEEDLIAEYASRDTDLELLAELLEAASRRVEGTVVVKQFDDARIALRDYADREDGGDVADKPVFVSGLPRDKFVGGRLIDSCTSCSPRPMPDTSILRIAKVGAQRWSTAVERQVAKDAYLIDQGFRLEWHFYPGATGGAVDARMLDELRHADIPIVVHVPD